MDSSLPATMDTVDSSLPATMDTVDSSNLPATMDTVDSSLPATMDTVDSSLPATMEAATSDPTPPQDIIILFDLETTGLPTDSDITQIATLEVFGKGREWSRYLVPNKDIESKASEITGLQVEETDNGRRILMKGVEEVDAASYEEGLSEFYEYLCDLIREQRVVDPNARLILTAHNAERFDAPVLINAFKKINVTSEELRDSGICFADSLVILRKLRSEDHPLLTHPEEGKKISLGLASIYNHLFGEDYPAHDASEDVKAMKRVLFHPPLELPQSIISDNTFNL